MKIKFEPRDIWVGLYWKTEPRHPNAPVCTCGYRITFYLCLIPMLPIIWKMEIYK